MWLSFSYEVLSADVVKESFEILRTHPPHDKALSWISEKGPRTEQTPCPVQSTILGDGREAFTHNWPAVLHPLSLDPGWSVL